MNVLQNREKLRSGPIMCVIGAGLSGVAATKFNTKVLRAYRQASDRLAPMEGCGLPAPDPKPCQPQGTLPTEFLLRAGGGDLTAKKSISRFDGNPVVQMPDSMAVRAAA